MSKLLILAMLLAGLPVAAFPGVGDAIAEIVTKLHATRTHPALEKMRKEIPAGVLEMLTVPKVLKLYQELGLSSLTELKEAVRGDRLRKT
jgi:DNA polymerase (family 10)